MNLNKLKTLKKIFYKLIIFLFYHRVEHTTAMDLGLDGAFSSERIGPGVCKLL
jgi:hypothetical protein